jgi:hypothetical protein
VHSNIETDTEINPNYCATDDVERLTIFQPDVSNTRCRQTRFR